MGLNSDTSQDPRTDVTDWRKRTLIDAGIDPVVANRLARDPEVDLHALLELVDVGCPAHLAARILAPLDAAWDTTA